MKPRESRIKRLLYVTGYWDNLSDDDDAGPDIADL